MRVSLLFTLHRTLRVGFRMYSCTVLVPNCVGSGTFKRSKAFCVAQTLQERPNLGALRLPAKLQDNMSTVST